MGSATISTNRYSEKAMKNLYSNEYITINLEEKDKLLYYKIIGYPKFSEIIRNGHDRMYEFVRQMKKEAVVENLIADLTDAKILLNPDIRFIANVSYPRLAKNGIRNLAILLTDDIHVKINVQKTIEYLGPDVFDHVNTFSCKEDALEWFRGLNA